MLCGEMVMVDLCTHRQFCAADEAGHHLSTAELVLHFTYVEKKFAVPGPYMQELLDMYALLNHLNLPGTIHCRSLKVCTTFAAQASSRSNFRV